MKAWESFLNLMAGATLVAMKNSHELGRKALKNNDIEAFDKITQKRMEWKSRPWTHWLLNHMEKQADQQEDLFYGVIFLNQKSMCWMHEWNEKIKAGINDQWLQRMLDEEIMSAWERGWEAWLKEIFKEALKWGNAQVAWKIIAFKNKNQAWIHDKTLEMGLSQFWVEGLVASLGGDGSLESWNAWKKYRVSQNQEDFLNGSPVQENAKNPENGMEHLKTKNDDERDAQVFWNHHLSKKLIKEGLDAAFNQAFINRKVNQMEVIIKEAKQQDCSLDLSAKSMWNALTVESWSDEAIDLCTQFLSGVSKGSNQNINKKTQEIHDEWNENQNKDPADALYPFRWLKWVIETIQKTEKGIEKNVRWPIEWKEMDAWMSSGEIPQGLKEFDTTSAWSVLWGWKENQNKKSNEWNFVKSKVEAEALKETFKESDERKIKTRRL